MDRLERLRASVLDAIERLPHERIPSSTAARRWLAEAVLALRPVPPFTCSAMDGYAVRACDVSGPARLRVTSTVFAGEVPWAEVGPGEAVRIFTGAPVPPGADAVVRQEAAREIDGVVELREDVAAGDNVRQAGEDLTTGAVALDAGTRIGGRQLALLASAGTPEVLVTRRPRVALVCTGDEIVGRRTPNSNGAAIAESLRELGAEVEAHEVGDDLDHVSATIERALDTCDAVVTIGGVSVGERDHVTGAIERLGGDVRVHGVPMKPGKPFLFATVRRNPIFGLPGSPSACLVAFEVFARPALLRLAGAAQPFRRSLWLPLAEAVSGRPGRARFLWARLGEDGRVRPIGRDAAQIRGPALADVLVWLREGTGDVSEGALVEAWLLDGGAA